MDKSCKFKTQRWAFFVSQATPLRGKLQLDTESLSPGPRLHALLVAGLKQRGAQRARYDPWFFAMWTQHDLVKQLKQLETEPFGGTSHDLTLGVHRYARRKQKEPFGGTSSSALGNCDGLRSP